MTDQSPDQPSRSQQRSEAVLPVGKELPDKPGVWWRYGTLYEVSKPNAQMDLLLATRMISSGYIPDAINVRKLPGGWLPASAPLGESEREQWQRDIESYSAAVALANEQINGVEAELSQARAEAADRDEWAAKYSATFGQLTAALERAEAAEAELAKVYDQRDAAYKRIQAIIEVAGHLQPTDIRNAACWIIAPPHVGIPRLEEWIIDAQISQRWNEIDRVEKVINLCLEKHFSELRQRAEGAEAELSEAKRELQEVYWIYQISMEAHEAAEAERERLREALANVRKTPIGTIAEALVP